MQRVESAIGRLSGTLPPGTSFEVRRMDPTVFPVIAYSLVSDTHSLVELRDLALYRIRPALSSIDGVSRIGVPGGRTADFQVMVDPARLDAFGLTMSEVASSLRSAPPPDVRSSKWCDQSELILASAGAYGTPRSSESCWRWSCRCSPCTCFIPDTPSNPPPARPRFTAVMPG